MFYEVVERCYHRKKDQVDVEALVCSTGRSILQFGGEER